MHIAITGHRPQTLGLPFNTQHASWDWIRTQLQQAFEDFEADKLYIGLAQGVDTLAAQLAVANGIPFIAAVPFVGQEDLWPEVAKRTYYDLLLDAEDVVYVSEPGYAAWKLHKRNEFMVDHSDIVVAVYTGVAGGTAACIRYAQKQQLPVWHIDPEQQQAGWYRVECE